MLTECLRYTDPEGRTVRRLRDTHIGSWIEVRERDGVFESRTSKDAYTSIYCRDNNGKRPASWKKGLVAAPAPPAGGATVELYYRWAHHSVKYDACFGKGLSLYNVPIFGCLLPLVALSGRWCIVEDNVEAGRRYFYEIPHDKMPGPEDRSYVEVLVGPQLDEDTLVLPVNRGQTPLCTTKFGRPVGSEAPWKPVITIGSRCYEVRDSESAVMTLFLRIHEEMEMQEEKPEPEPEPEPEPAPVIAEEVERMAAGEPMLVGKTDEELLRDCRACLHAADAKLDPWTRMIAGLFRDPAQHMTRAVTPACALAYVRAFGALRRVVYDELLPALWQGRITQEGGVKKAMVILQKLVVSEDGTSVRVAGSFDRHDKIVEHAIEAARAALP